MSSIKKNIQRKKKSSKKKKNNIKPYLFEPLTLKEIASDKYGSIINSAFQGKFSGLKLISL